MLGPQIWSSSVIVVLGNIGQLCLLVSIKGWNLRRKTKKNIHTSLSTKPAFDPPPYTSLSVFLSRAVHHQFIRRRVFDGGGSREQLIAYLNSYSPRPINPVYLISWLTSCSKHIPSCLTTAERIITSLPLRIFFYLSLTVLSLFLRHFLYCDSTFKNLSRIETWPKRSTRLHFRPCLSLP